MKLVIGARSEALSTNDPPHKTQPVVIVDAGHSVIFPNGKADPGAMWPGVDESTLTLDIARRLSASLRDSGVLALMTRDAMASTLMPADRAEFANYVGADALISIHLNSNRYLHSGGTSTFYYTDQSKRLAQLVQLELLKSLRLRDREVLRTPTRRGHPPLALLRLAKMPAVLIEPAFLSNPYERALLQMPEFRQSIAAAVARGVMTHLKERTVPPAASP